MVQFLILLFLFHLSYAADPLILPDPAQKTFEYTFTLEWKLTMATVNDSTGTATLLKYDIDNGVYLIKSCDQSLACNATFPMPPGVPIFPDVITADGKHRRIMMINGQYPGPTIVVPYGSQVVVKIENKLEMEGITIHFHGQDKRNEWFMDGVARLQQCPIPSGSDFTYKFTADTAGTHFYHGHLGSDRVEGVFGAFVVMPEDRSVQLHNGTKIIPDVEYSLILFDWNTVSGTELWYNHRWRTMKFLYGYENEDECWRPTRMIDGTHIGGSYPFSGIIINQKGWYDQNDILNRPWQLDMETFEVEKGSSKSYLFRMVNAGQSLGLIISVEDHKLEVVSTDGAPIKSVPTDFIIIFPGERYDFVLIPKDNPDRDIYYMIVETMDYYDYFWQRMEPFYGLAKIKYANNNTIYTPDVNHTRCTETNKCTVVNCPFPQWPDGYNRTCVNVEDLQYNGAVQKDVLQQGYSNESGDIPYEEYFLNFHYDNVMNGWLFEYPKGPPYFYSQNESAVMYPCTEDNWKGTRNSWCTITLNMTLGSVVQLVLYNTGQGGDMEEGFHHPVHLHGAHFYVVKVGYGEYNESTGMLEKNNQDIPCADNTMQCDNLKWANESWLNGNVPGMNLVDPVFKDTVTLPVGGYVVLRFKADNPGWWVMHCHILVHHMGGMAFGIRIGTYEQMAKPPSNFPACGVFVPVYDQQPSSGMSQTIDNIILILLIGVLFYTNMA